MSNYTEEKRLSGKYPEAGEKVILNILKGSYGAEDIAVYNGSELVLVDSSSESICPLFYCPKHDFSCRINHMHIKAIPLPVKDKEWPKVGDKVEFPSGKGTLCVCEPDDQGIVIVQSEYEDLGFIYKRVAFSAIKKPKTKDDLLTEELQAKLCNNNYVDNFTLASDIINGMIPGLSYNSDIESAVKDVINKHLDGDA